MVNLAKISVNTSLQIAVISFLAIAAIEPFEYVGAKTISNYEMMHACVLPYKGGKLFVGERTCFKSLPHQRLSGIWIAELERSDFTLGDCINDSVAKHDEKVFWLDIDRDTAFRRVGFDSDDRLHVFRISFISQKSTRPGLYGHFGMYKKGIVVNRLLQIEPLRSEPVCSKPQAGKSHL